MNIDILKSFLTALSVNIGCGGIMFFLLYALVEGIGNGFRPGGLIFVSGFFILCVVGGAIKSTLEEHKY